MTSRQHTKDNSHLRLSLCWTISLDLDGQERCWDALVVWCAQHGAYLGGKPSRAFVLIRSTSTVLQRQLGKWLARQPGIASFELTILTFPSPPHSRANAALAKPVSTGTQHDAPAILEALTHYQQHLQDQMQWTIGQLMLVQRCHLAPN